MTLSAKRSVLWLVSVAFVFAAVDTGLAQSDPFTQVTEGDVVHDGGGSIGCAWGDYDGDGHQDLVVANGYALANFLYKGNGDGTFTKITSGDIVSDATYSAACTWGDYDNDGDLDLYVTNSGGTSPEANLFYRNNGDGTFTKVTSGSLVEDVEASAGCSWGDWTGDNFLDLIVANGSFLTSGRNSLYNNNGDGTFTKVTSGDVIAEDGNWSGVAWADFDNDGDLDLFICRDSNQNNALFVNDGAGNLTKVTSGDIVSDGGESQGASWGDYDNDGYLDLFVANWDQQNNFLYHNNGDGTFTKVTDGPVVNDGGYSIGSGWADIDNDGDLDLFVSNDGDNPAFLYFNNGDGTFTRDTTSVAVDSTNFGRGLAFADIDEDGDLDLFVTRDGDNRLYLNNGTSNHWINIHLVGTTSNPSAIGAKIRLKATIGGVEVLQYREISGQTGSASQNSLNAHFGLGDATVIDSIHVKWPSGIEQVLTDVGVDQFLTITESEGGILGDVNGDDLANSTDALIILSCDVGIDVSQYCPMNCGDCNADTYVNSTDALIILSYDVGIEVPYNVGQPGCPSSVEPCPGCNP